MIPPQHIIGFAIEASIQSPCRSQRGAAIWQGEDLISTGFNRKPIGFRCDQSDKCKKVCALDAIHAEQAAIIHASNSIRGADMLHVKTIDGKLVESMKPSCLQCSKLILEMGIAGMWLYHHTGWHRYNPLEFHYLSGAYLCT